MKLLKYNLEISDQGYAAHIHALINQIYKLLPNREQGLEWERPLATIIEQFAGIQRLVSNEEIFIPLIFKLQGLFSLQKEQDFQQYRKTIFECLNLAGKLVDKK